MKRSLVPLLLISMLSAVSGSCGQGESPSRTLSSATPEAISIRPIEKEWTFESAAVLARGPLKVMLKVIGAAPNSAFVWSVTVLDSTGAVLFQAEHKEDGLEELFGAEGMISGCKGYQGCKDKWYFEELPNAVSGAVEIVDNSSQPVEKYQRDALAQLADEFLKGRGMSDEKRAEVLGEMQSALAGRFDSFGLWAAHPVHGDTTAFMYVPSVGYFVPYWHP